MLGVDPNITIHKFAVSEAIKPTKQT